jgi:hypothetical protein
MFGTMTARPLGEWLRAYARAWMESPSFLFYQPEFQDVRPEPDASRAPQEEGVCQLNG